MTCQAGSQAATARQSRQAKPPGKAEAGWQLRLGAVGHRWCVMPGYSSEAATASGGTQTLLRERRLSAPSVSSAAMRRRLEPCPVTHASYEECMADVKSRHKTALWQPPGRLLACCVSARQSRQPAGRRLPVGCWRASHARGLCQVKKERNITPWAWVEGAGWVLSPGLCQVGLLR